MLEYATQAEIWPSGAPADAAELTLHANALVARATRTAVYNVDSAGYPASSVLRALFKDAVTYQAKYWADNGLKPYTELEAASAPKASAKRIGSASIDYTDDSVTEKMAAREARLNALTTLCPTAYYILDNVGLLSGVVRRG